MNIYKIRFGTDDHVYASNDKYLYCEVDDDTFISNEDEVEQQSVFAIDGKLVRCSTSFVYSNMYDTYLKKYGDRSDELKVIYEKFLKCLKSSLQEERRDKGYITYLKDYEDLEPEDYYGLLEKYFTNNTRKYIDSKLVFGYLGHEDRTRESDQAICEFLEENPELLQKVNDDFLTNSTGRHYMDEYQGPEKLKEFLKIVLN